MEGFFLIWKEANQAHRIQYKTKAEQNIFWQGLNNMKIVSSSATEKPKVSSTPYPHYLFSLIIFSFQVGDCAVKLTNAHKNHPPVLCGPPSFAAAALQVRAKIRRKLNFPAGVSSIPHSVHPDLPRCQSSSSVTRLCSYYTAPNWSTCHPLQPFDVQRGCPANNILFLNLMQHI